MRTSRPHNDSASSLPTGAWAGRRCFCVGAGPSLRGFDWHSIAGECVIGANRAFEYCEPSVIVSTDGDFYQHVIDGDYGEWARQRFDATNARKIWVTQRADNPFTGHGVQRVRCLGKRGVSWNLEQGVYNGQSSGFAALSLALALGCREIYLLGYDLIPDAGGGQQWHHDGHPHTEHSDVDVYQKYRQHFEALAPELAREKVNIYNCSTNSALQCWPCAKVGSWRKLDRPRVHIGGSGAAARVTAQSVTQWGLTVAGADPVDNPADIPNILLRAINDHQSAVYVAPGVEVNEYPAPLDNADADVILHEQTGGVVFVKPTAQARTLLEWWRDWCVDAPDNPAHMTLHNVLASGKLDDIPRSTAAFQCTAPGALAWPRERVTATTPLPDVPMRMAAEQYPADALATAPRVIIVGGGPSLKGFDWARLKNECVIGANRAFEKPHVGAFATIDSRFIQWVRAGKLGCETEQSWRLYDGAMFYAAFLGNASNAADSRLCIIPRFEDHYAVPTLEAFDNTNNSGLAALKVAWAMGAKNIKLIGFDLRGKSGKQAWHHRPYPAVKSDSEYIGMAKQFYDLAPRLVEDGVRVTVYGESALECFPRADHGDLYAELGQQKPAWPLVVNCYTANTGYAAESREMAQTARMFGMPVYRESFQGCGEWTRNAAHKVRFIRECLDRFRRPLLWLDADARIRRYPSLFAEWGRSHHDIGLSWFRWRQITKSRRNIDDELSSAVMLFRPTTRTFNLLADWQAACEADPETLEQRVLQSMLERGALENMSVLDIPMKYNQIFDSMAGLGSPVIEQMQASRRLKAEVGAS